MRYELKIERPLSKRGRYIEAEYVGGFSTHNSIFRDVFTSKEFCSPNRLNNIFLFVSFVSVIALFYIQFLNMLVLCPQTLLVSSCICAFVELTKRSFIVHSNYSWSGILLLHFERYHLWLYVQFCVLQLLTIISQPHIWRVSRLVNHLASPRLELMLQPRFKWQLSIFFSM